MALIPFRPRQELWDPFAQMQTIQGRMNRLFGSIVPEEKNRGADLFGGIWNPDVNVVEAKDNVTVKLNIPGLKKEDIQATVQGDTLVIKGEKKHEKAVKEKDYLRTERFYSNFQRAIRLPAKVQAKKADATYKSGVLKLVLLKNAKADSKQAKLEIK